MSLTSLQYKFKPQDTSPGFEDGQEASVHKGLTEYAADCGVPVFVLQLWRGEGEKAHVEGYAVVDRSTKQVMFVDRRHDVVEYIIEQLAEQLQQIHDERASTESAQNSEITEDNKKDD